MSNFIILWRCDSNYLTTKKQTNFWKKVLTKQKFSYKIIQTKVQVYKVGGNQYEERKYI